MAAVKAGVRSIEHGTYLSDATLQLMKERGTYFDPTYTTVIDLTDAGGDYDVPALRIRGAAHAAAPARHRRPRAQARREDRHRQRHRLRPEQPDAHRPGGDALRRDGLHAARGDPVGDDSSTPRCCGSRSRSASLEAGYEADLIAVEGNPLENIATIQDPLLVISNGRVGLDRLNFAK